MLLDAHICLTAARGVSFGNSILSLLLRRWCRRILSFSIRYPADVTAEALLFPSLRLSRTSTHGSQQTKAESRCRVSRCSRLRQVPFFKDLASQVVKSNVSHAGKRIALPTRVEPKVFFANERTFLSWLNFTVILGALAIGMLNFGDRPAFISAFLFTGVAMATMIYALITYHWRAKSIRMRGQAGFDDRFGPTFLAIILLLAVVVNFVLRITYSSQDHHP